MARSIAVVTVLLAFALIEPRALAQQVGAVDFLTLTQSATATSDSYDLDGTEYPDQQSQTGSFGDMLSASATSDAKYAPTYGDASATTSCSFLSNGIDLNQSTNADGGFTQYVYNPFDIAGSGADGMASQDFKFSLSQPTSVSLSIDAVDMVGGTTSQAFTLTDLSTEVQIDGMQIPVGGTFYDMTYQLAAGNYEYLQSSAAGSSNFNEGDLDSYTSSQMYTTLTAVPEPLGPAGATGCILATIAVRRRWRVARPIAV